MNLRSSGTSTWSPMALLERLVAVVEPVLEDVGHGDELDRAVAWSTRALAAAPVPRPPQPTRATWIVLSSAAWTAGTATPARAEAAATWPVVLRKSRRDALGFDSVMMLAPWGDRRECRVGIRAGRDGRQAASAANTRVGREHAGVGIEQPASGAAHRQAIRWRETLTLFISLTRRLRSSKWLVGPLSDIENLRSPDGPLGHTRNSPRRRITGPKRV